MLIRGNAVRLRMLSTVSKNQNKLRKCCIKSFFLKTDIIGIGKVASLNNHSSACYSEIRACSQITRVLDFF